MNSRDAAYDYSSLFPHGRDGGTSVDDNDPTKMDDTSPPGSRAGDSTSAHRRRRGGGVGGKRVADEDDEDTVSLARSLKRRRGSNETEEVMDTAPRGKKTSSKRKDTDSDNGREDSSSEVHHHHQGSATPLLDAPPASTSSRNGKRGGGPGNGKGGRPRPMIAKSERVDSEEPPLTPTFRRNALDDVIRPARARVPQARSGMNEMRKRVGAILEYVGRLQADVAPATGTSTPCTLLSPDTPLFCFFIFSRGLTV